MKFVKMHGTGNDFVVLSPPKRISIGRPLPSLYAIGILGWAPTD